MVCPLFLPKGTSIDGKEIYAWKIIQRIHPLDLVCILCLTGRGKEISSRYTVALARRGWYHLKYGSVGYMDKNESEPSTKKREGNERILGTEYYCVKIVVTHRSERRLMFHRRGRVYTTHPTYATLTAT